jgi:hypothetical protein
MSRSDDRKRLGTASGKDLDVYSGGREARLGRCIGIGRLGEVSTLAMMMTTMSGVKRLDRIWAASLYGDYISAN